MSLPNDAHIGQVSLTVRDLDRSLLFYRDVLGFRDITAPRDAAPRTAYLGAGARVLLELREGTNAVARPRRSTGLFHFAILVPSRAALGRSLRRLSGKQWPMSGASDHLVSEALYLDDPDGLGIEIYRDRPREEWPIVNGQLALTFGTVAGQTYQVEYKNGLGDPAWLPLGSPVVAGGASLTLSDQIGANPPRFYRIRITD